jgi:hypothetical protein
MDGALAQKGRYSLNSGLGNCQAPTRKLLEILRKSFGGKCASHSCMKTENRKIFDEEYRVLSVESQRLTIQGVRSGEVLTIQTENPESPLSAAEYPPGQLITLRDPSGALPN